MTEATAARLSQPIADASAWYEPAMMQREDWIVRLSPAEVAELDAATASVNADLTVNYG